MSEASVPLAAHRRLQTGDLAEARERPGQVLRRDGLQLLRGPVGVHVVHGMTELGRGRCAQEHRGMYRPSPSHTVRTGQ